MPAKFGQKFHSSFCFKIATDLKARLHWSFYLDENIGVLATVSMFVIMDVYDSRGKQIHQPWDVVVWKIEKVLFFQNVTPKVQG